MADVHLRAITADNVRACVGLKVAESQASFVATNGWSMAQAKANPLLVPLAVYDGAARGYPKSVAPMVGFVMYEVDCRVGLIVRLMIDQKYQRQGYGRRRAARGDPPPPADPRGGDDRHQPSTGEHRRRAPVRERGVRAVGGGGPAPDSWRGVSSATETDAVNAFPEPQRPRRPMDPKDVKAYAERDWALCRASKDDYWAREFALRGSEATLAASEMLRLHMRLIRPDWPTDEDRRADFAHHVELKALIHRAAEFFRNVPR